jgi:hypothetical protein
MFFFGPSRCNFKRTAKIEKNYTNTNAIKILATNILQMVSLLAQKYLLIKD